MTLAMPRAPALPLSTLRFRASARLAGRAAATAAAMVAVGCSTLAADPAPGCRGARRPANLHGSVLAPAAAEAVPAPVVGPVGGCGAPRP